MHHTNHHLPDELPVALRRQFAALERRLWKIETTTALGFAGGALLVSWLVLWVSDRLWETPVWFRAVGAALGALVLAAALARWWRRWVFRRRDLRALAVLVQRRYARLGDRLLGIVELAEEKEHAPDFSPSLYRAAIQQVAAEAARFDFREAVNPRPAKRFLLAVVALAAVCVLLAVAMPAVAWNVFQRWLTPLARVERLTLTRLAELPPELIVPHGEPFTLRGKVAYNSLWKPGRVRARLDGQPVRTTRVLAGAFTVALPGQNQTGVLHVRVGDAEHRMRVIPTLRPVLRELTATVRLPDYLELAEQQQPVAGGVLPVLEGSRVALAGRTTRTLASAELHLDEPTTLPLTVEGDGFRSGFLTPDGLVQCALVWTDALGLSNSPPAPVLLQPQPDAPPLPQLPSLARDLAIWYGDVLEVGARARDDFGVRSLGLAWAIVGGGSDEATTAAAITEVRVDASRRDEKEIERTFRWSPSLFRVPPDTIVELTAFARDFHPTRDRVYSAPCHIFILGDERHADLVRQQLDSLLARLEEVTRLEEKILAQTLEAMTGATNLAGQIEAALQNQTANTVHLEQLVSEGAQTLREALKNPAFPEAVVRQWTHNLQAMQQLAQQTMNSAAAALNSARHNEATRARDLQAAEQHERDAIQQLAELQARMSQHLDDLRALTLAQRLRQVGEWQKQIEQALQRLAPETIGLLPRELPPRLQQANAALAGTQSAAQTEAQQLQAEISRFFERTQKTNYGAVSREMQEAQTVDALDRLRGMIERNLAMQASLQSGQWAGRFADWADRLEPKEFAPACSGEGACTGQESERDLTRTLIALLRLRQAESRLREETRVLNAHPGETADYRSRALRLAEQQAQLTATLSELSAENAIAELTKPYEETATAMREVERLLAIPQTDLVADAAHGRAIDGLTDLINLINEQAKRRPPRPGSGGEGQNADAEAIALAFLLQAMAAGNQPSQNPSPAASPGGGNFAGGTTERVSAPVAGDPTGRAVRERRVQRAGGAAAQFPAEFREVLEQYFRALEQTPE